MHKKTQHIFTTPSQLIRRIQNEFKYTFILFLFIFSIVFSVNVNTDLHTHTHAQAELLLFSVSTVHIHSGATTLDKLGMSERFFCFVFVFKVGRRSKI